MGKNLKTEKRETRRKRIRAKISGTVKIPRLSIFRSNKYIYAQLVDDMKGNTIVASSSKDLKTKTKTKTKGKVEVAKAVGKDIAEKASAKKIKEVVFDRGGYIYTGRVKALAEGARESGLKF